MNTYLILHLVDVSNVNIVKYKYANNADVNQLRKMRHLRITECFLIYKYCYVNNLFRQNGKFWLC